MVIFYVEKGISWFLLGFFYVDQAGYLMIFPWSPHDRLRGLAEEIGGHAADIEAASKEKQNATELRETTRSDFVATLKDPDLRDLFGIPGMVNIEKTMETSKIELIQLVKGTAMLSWTATY